MMEKEANIYVTSIETAKQESGDTTLTLTVYVDDLALLLWACQINSVKSLINIALSLIAWAVEEAKDGQCIVSINEETMGLDKPNFSFINKISPTTIQ